MIACDRCLGRMDHHQVFAVFALNPHNQPLGSPAPGFEAIELCDDCVKMLVLMFEDFLAPDEEG